VRYAGNYSGFYVAWVTLLYVLYILGFPVAIALASPYILLWPLTMAGPDGQGAGRIKTNYLSIVRVWEKIGHRLPVLR
jgi:hypothetical protein